jgi:hypothetical protein
LQRGEIKHVLGIALVDAEKWSIYSYPANRSDGYNPTDAPNRIPEGLRFRLDPTVDVDALRRSWKVCVIQHVQFAGSVGV